MNTIQALLSTAKQRLADSGLEASGREAALLLGHVLQLSEAQLYARSRDTVPSSQEETFEALWHRRLQGEPVAHLLGEREFYGRPFYVDRRVLIPRPETEHLIEAALRLPLPAGPKILDIGTGSGCIALTLGLELPAAKVIAGDLSLPALQVFNRNRKRLAAEEKQPGTDLLTTRVAPFLGDLATAIRLHSFDLLVSNPPYIEPAAAPSLPPDVREFEPHMALFSPGGGRTILQRLLRQCLQLPPGAHALFEIGYDQSQWLRQQVTDLPGLEVLALLPDLAQIERIALLRRS